MKHTLRIVLAGCASIVTELVLIRYMPGRVRVLGYFTNFVLLAAFLGLGSGMTLARREKTGFLSWLSPVALLVVIGLAELAGLLRVGGSGEEFLFLEYDRASAEVSLALFLTAAFVVLAASFVPLGHCVGRTLMGDQPLRIYAWNLVGSLLGVVLFAGLSAAETPPWSWIAVALVIGSVALFGAPRVWWAVGAACGIAACGIAWHAAGGAVYSPYQKITTAVLRVHPELGVVQEWSLPQLSEAQRSRLEVLPESEGFTVRVNDDSYQTPLDLRDEAVARHPSLGALRQQYDLPFKGAKAGDVLVLGAGTGNDVAAALRNGATHVDAVEIDPEILGLGRKHPEHPYGDPRVTVHLDDARSFLARTDKTFDTVVYGLLDSHVLLSQMSNVRLDSYVFTAESFATARQRLKPGGRLVVSHAVCQPWFIERMRASLARAFDGKTPTIISGENNAIGYTYLESDSAPPGAPLARDARPLTDDWPFLYLSSRKIPTEYLFAMAMIALLAYVTVAKVTGRKISAVDGTFFFLGAGFLLVETRGVTALALLVGSTWRVTTAVFAGVLAMALVSTGLAAVLRKHDGRTVDVVIYALLGMALLVMGTTSLGRLASLPMGIAGVVGALLVSLPLLASGVVFSRAMARTGDAESALASNLLGALCGGLTEYLSMVVGFQALVVVAAAFYGAAVFCDVRR